MHQASRSHRPQAPGRKIWRTSRDAKRKSRQDDRRRSAHSVPPTLLPARDCWWTKSLATYLDDRSQRRPYAPPPRLCRRSDRPERISGPHLTWNSIVEDSVRQILYFPPADSFKLPAFLSISPTLYLASYKCPHQDLLPPFVEAFIFCTIFTRSSISVCAHVVLFFIVNRFALA